MRIFVAVSLALLLLTFPALAQSAASAAPPDTVVVVPIGTWVDDLLKIVASVAAVAVGAMVTWVLSLLPKAIGSYIASNFRAQVEQILLRAVDYGINAVSGAVKGKELNIDVGSEVVANAAQYVVDHGPAKLVDAMGGEEGIKEKIVARLPLAAEATAGAVIANSAPLR